jgi:hypothetical protein
MQAVIVTVVGVAAFAAILIGVDRAYGERLSVSGCILTLGGIAAVGSVLIGVTSGHDWSFWASIVILLGLNFWLIDRRHGPRSWGR